MFIYPDFGHEGDATSQCTLHDSPAHNHFISTPTPKLRTRASMKFTIIKKLWSPSTVKISGASITEVAGDSHTHYGDIYLNKITSYAGNQLRSHYSTLYRILIMNRFSLANNLGLRFDGCRLRFPGARPSSSMSSWNTEGSFGQDRNVGQGW